MADCAFGRFSTPTREMREGHHRSHEAKSQCDPLTANTLEGTRTMAGRPIGKLHQDDVRKKIQASQLINVLQDHALNGGDDMSQSRMKAIEILLRKSIPDLSAVQLSGDENNPIRSSLELVFRSADGNRVS
jgi:hypothetical protein